MSSTKSDVALRMRHLRQALGGIRQEDMARQMDGISRSVLANVESERQFPSRNLLEALAEHFNVNGFWLLFGEGEMFRSDVVAHKAWRIRLEDRLRYDGKALRIEHPDLLDMREPPEAGPEPDVPLSPRQHVELVWERFETVRDAKPQPLKAALKSEGMVELPLHDLRAAAGRSGRLVDELPEHLGNYSMSEALLHRVLHINPAHALLVIVDGPSMEPDFNDGELVIADTSVNHVPADAVYFFSIGDEHFLKRLQRLPGGGLKMLSSNKDFESYTLTAEQLAQLRIIGRIGVHARMVR